MQVNSKSVKIRSLSAQAPVPFPELATICCVCSQKKPASMNGPKMSCDSRFQALLSSLIHDDSFFFGSMERLDDLHTAKLRRKICWLRAFAISALCGSPIFFPLPSLCWQRKNCKRFHHPLSFSLFPRHPIERRVGLPSRAYPCGAAYVH